MPPSNPIALPGVPHPTTCARSRRPTESDGANNRVVRRLCSRKVQSCSPCRCRRKSAENPGDPADPTPWPKWREPRPTPCSRGRIQPFRAVSKSAAPCGARRGACFLRCAPRSIPSGAPSHCADPFLRQLSQGRLVDFADLGHRKLPEYFDVFGPFELGDAHLLKKRGESADGDVCGVA